VYYKLLRGKVKVLPESVFVRGAEHRSVQLVPGDNLGFMFLLLNNNNYRLGEFMASKKQVNPTFAIRTPKKVIFGYLSPGNH
jgi:hypothetical protein